MFLLTERCIIRNFILDDASDLYEILSDSMVMKYIEPPFSMEQTKAFIAHAGLCDIPLVYALVWRKTEKVIGHVIFHPYEEESFEIGWILKQSYWCKGIATEITTELIKYAAASGIKSFIIECNPMQSASIHIAKKLGFVFERKDEECSIYRLML